MSEALRWRAFRRAWPVWAWWERLMLRLYPVTYIHDGSLFSYTLHGDVLTLHVLGRDINRLRARGASGFAILRELRSDLGALANRIRAGHLAGVRLITATSLMGEAGGLLGFDPRPAPRTVANAFRHYFMVGLDAIHHPSGLRRRVTQRRLVETTMTVAELLERYPAKSDRSTLAR